MAEEQVEERTGTDQEPAAPPESAPEEAPNAAAQEPEAPQPPEPSPSPPEQPSQPPAKPKADGAGPNLDFILDLPLEVSVELGRASMLVGELLQLGQGAVVELNKLAEEPLEVLVNNKLVARGEAVVINEKFGVRITDVVPADERVKRLG